MDLVASKQYKIGGYGQVLVALDILRTSLVVVIQSVGLRSRLVVIIQQQTQEPPQEELSLVVLSMSSLVVMSMSSLVIVIVLLRLRWRYVWC